MKYVVLLLLGLWATHANGFQGDWVLTERFNKQLSLAKQGDAAAQYDVGKMYQHGRGVAADVQEAETWLNRSAKQGNVSAQTSLGVMYFEGEKITPNYTRAFSLLQSAAARNVAQAQFYLGRIYEEGRGVKPNIKLALRWYNRAAKTGYFGADEKVAVLGAQLQTTARAAVKKRPVPKTKKAPATSPVLKRVLEGNWHRADRPAGYLPSTITQCKMATDSKALNCKSTSQTRRTLAAEITYSTQAHLHDFNGQGQFKLSYVNEVSGVQPLENQNTEREEGGLTVSVKTGDKSREHVLVCRMESDKKLFCVRDKVQNLSFVSP